MATWREPHTVEEEIRGASSENTDQMTAVRREPFAGPGFADGTLLVCCATLPAACAASPFCCAVRAAAYSAAFFAAAAAAASSCSAFLAWAAASSSASFCCLRSFMSAIKSSQPARCSIGSHVLWFAL